MSCGDLFLGMIAILFPPIAVWIKSGICSCDSLINILLCMLGYFPGLLHAWYIIARNPERDYDYETIPDSEGQRVTFYYVRHEPARGDYGSTRGNTNRPAPPPPSTKPQNNTAPVGGEGGSGSGSNRPAPPPPTHQQPEGPSVGAGGEDAGAPPSYSDVVKGDHKIQSQD